MFVDLAPKILGRRSGSIDFSGRHQLLNFAGGGSSIFTGACDAADCASLASSPSPVCASRTETESPDREQVTRRPANFDKLSNSSESKQVAKKTFRFLARTEMCARTSGASGVMTPTTPGGTSSSPLTLDARRTVGLSYETSCTERRSRTSTNSPTTPLGLPAEMTCHLVPPPWARSARSSLRRSVESTNEHPPPRMSSSLKRVIDHFSGIFSGVTAHKP
mmetsp:Transcript_61226/g.164452  ORF Transcript_61226/g.164452 Transcript_61226/m.164452 type:complete len:220 (-) Transcript_61226:1590-2249(-)